MDKNVLKEMRNSGQEYVSLSVGRHSRRLKERCRFKCDTISDDQRKEVFDKYWGLPNIDQKRYFLANLMQPIVNEKYYAKMYKSCNINKPHATMLSIFVLRVKIIGFVKSSFDYVRYFGTGNKDGCYEKERFRWSANYATYK